MGRLSVGGLVAVVVRAVWVATPKEAGPAWTVQPPPARGPLRNVPPHARTRCAIESIPRPPPGSSRRAPPSSSTASSSRSSRAFRRTCTVAPAACLAAFVSASAATHTTAWRTCGSTPVGLVELELHLLAGRPRRVGDARELGRDVGLVAEDRRQPPQLGGALARGHGERLVVGFQAALESRRGHAGLDRDRRQRVADEVVQLVCEAHPLGANGPRAEPLERVRDLGAAVVHLLLLGRDVAQEHAEHPVPEVDERRSDERHRRPVHGGIEALGDHQPGDDEHEARGGAARAGRGRRDDERDDRREVGRRGPRSACPPRASTGSR